MGLKGGARAICCRRRNHGALTLAEHLTRAAGFSSASWQGKGRRTHGGVVEARCNTAKGSYTTTISMSGVLKPFNRVLDYAR